MGQNNSNRGGGRSHQPIDNTFGHLQPQALELEKAMLGAQLIDNKAHDLISGFAKKEIYYEPRHQMIQEAINTLATSRATPWAMCTPANSCGPWSGIYRTSSNGSARGTLAG